MIDRSDRSIGAVGSSTPNLCTVSVISPASLAVPKSRNPDDAGESIWSVEEKRRHGWNLDTSSPNGLERISAHLRVVRRRRGTTSPPP
ncbi:MAG: hypothetical protein KY432_11935, partial [Acidobacteria bacterium]|nr:hypothetical protein [Acidobacteriota bacterium]